MDPLTQSGRFLDLGVLHALAIGDIVKEQQHNRLERADYQVLLSEREVCSQLTMRQLMFPGELASCMFVVVERLESAN